MCFSSPVQPNDFCPIKTSTLSSFKNKKEANKPEVPCDPRWVGCEERASGLLSVSVQLAPPDDDPEKIS